MTWEVRQGDALEVLRDLPDGIAQTCATSPPYWGLRDYQHDEQLGHEPLPEQYVTRLVTILEEVRRVLRPDGTLWLVIGDSYTSGDRPYRAPDRRHNSRAMSYRPMNPPGLKNKELVGVPWKVAFALQACGWWLRSEVIWSKPNALPESVLDRPTRAHETVFLLTKSARYRYDVDAIREPFLSGPSDLAKITDGRVRVLQHDDPALRNGTGAKLGRQAAVGDPVKGRNKRTVWTIPTQAYRGDHHAVFPPRLVELMIRAGAPARGDLVLDPFAGSGTTGLVACRLERDFLGVELNPAIVTEARYRIIDDAPLFNGACESAVCGAREAA